jgi:hypothetical protein
MRDFPDNFMLRISKAQEILGQDPEYQTLLTRLKINENRYFNTFFRQSDKFVEEGEAKEMSLVQACEQREKALLIETAPNGFIYFSGSLNACGSCGI